MQIIGSPEHIAFDRVAFDFHPAGGSLHHVRFNDDDGRVVSPLHTAPWVGSQEALPAELSLVERQLSGDFFCAPFGVNTDEIPIHGWSANGHWQRDADSGSAQPDTAGKLSIRYRLEETISGARVTKTLTLHRDHPVLYQRHSFEGGDAHLPVAHHAMVRAPGGAALNFSPKQGGSTPSVALETDPSRGRSILAYPQTFASLGEVRGYDGQRFDAAFYPFADAHEDLLVLAEATPLPALAWSTVLAQHDGFLFFAIKDPLTLPETILWMSNGGRDYPPWSGRHTAVLGIEEAATAYHCEGHARTDSPGLSCRGLRTGLTLTPSRTRHICYAFGAIPAPTGWTGISAIHIDATALRIESTCGKSVSVAFDASHFRTDG